MTNVTGGMVPGRTPQPDGKGNPDPFDQRNKGPFEKPVIAKDQNDKDGGATGTW